jgi:cytochrome c oxidase subunit IV
MSVALLNCFQAFMFLGCSSHKVHKMISLICTVTELKYLVQNMVLQLIFPLIVVIIWFYLHAPLRNTAFTHMKCERNRRIVSSGMLRLVALVRAGILEELSASFIRMTRIGELGTT